METLTKHQYTMLEVITQHIRYHCVLCPNHLASILQEEIQSISETNTYSSNFVSTIVLFLRFEENPSLLNTAYSILLFVMKNYRCSDPGGLVLSLADIQRHFGNKIEQLKQSNSTVRNGVTMLHKELNYAHKCFLAKLPNTFFNLLSKDHTIDHTQRNTSVVALNKALTQMLRGAHYSLALIEQLFHYLQVEKDLSMAKEVLCILMIVMNYHPRTEY